MLHALNRFTFGPRPGDVAAVQAMGLKRWFEQQLNPASIDDSALEARLEMFPAMQMPQAELMRRYPSPQVLRQMIEQEYAAADRSGGTCDLCRRRLRSIRRRRRSRRRSRLGGCQGRWGDDAAGDGEGCVKSEGQGCAAGRWRGSGGTGDGDA